MELIFGALLALFFLRDEPPPQPPPPGPVSEELVVVLPAREGPVGSILVERADQRQLLDEPFEASRIRGSGMPAPDKLDEPRVRSEFGGVLDALPSLSDETVVLLDPGPDEALGTVVVERVGSSRQVLGEAYATSRIRSLGPPESGRLTAADVQHEFGDLLAALPSLTEELVVVIPADFDGHIGNVVVERAGVRRVLNEAYAASWIRSLGPPEASTMNQAEIQQMFASTLAAVPQPPSRYRLHFNLGTDDLTLESRAELQKVLAEIATRPVPDVVVIGHTDSLGTTAINDRLSLQRAERVKRLMIEVGIPADRITVSGRGSREPLVPTADGVEEPRNRRVDIDVR